MSDETKPLYTRPILQNIPVHLFDEQEIYFGTYNGRFENFSIKGLRRPFGNLPLPRFITNTRVNSLMRLLFQNDDVIGELTFFVSSFFSAMETVYWNKKTKKRNAYRQVLPCGFIHLPKRLGYNITACRTRRRYIRILSRLTRGALYADIDFPASTGRPALEARFDVTFSGKECAELSAVTPFFVNKRFEASYNFTAPMSGWLSENYFRDFIFPAESSVCFFDYRKAYCGLKTKRTFLSGFGRFDGKILSFQLNTSIAPDSDSYNDNLLFYGGEVTPLPPVKITMPFGIDKKWNIQDTEGMVDLTFEPASLLQRSSNFFLLRMNYTTVYGNFEGTLVRKNGSRIKLENYDGIAKRIQLRF